MPQSQTLYKNRLLTALSPRDLALVEPHLEPTPLIFRQVMQEPNKPITHVCFPEVGYVSIIANGKRDRRIEVGVVGREGVIGFPVLMGNDRSPLECFVQGEGSALRLPADALRQAMGQSESLRTALLHYAQAFMIQVSYTALANGRNKIEERLARWVLMAHDRIEGDDLPLTHEFLSLMLGVRRPGVTVALHLLEGQGLIRSTRGLVTVVDREGLEELADGSYGVPEAEYERLIALISQSAR